MAVTTVRKKKVAKKAKKSGRRQADVKALSRAQIGSAVKRMSAATGTDRFGAGKAVWITTQRDPARVYPHFDAIGTMLGHPSKVVCWNAMRILSLLVEVDEKRRVDDVLDEILSFVTGDNMISAANAIGAAAQIGRARPDLAERIVKGILVVQRANYATPECRNVAIGHALNAFASLGSEVCSRADVRGFVKSQTANTRPAVARRAAKMLRD